MGSAIRTTCGRLCRDAERASECNGIDIRTGQFHCDAMTVGRPKSYRPEIVLQRALDCFWSHGFEATSMQDLLACTGLSKSSLYEEFGSKRALFERCVITYREHAVAGMGARLAAAPSGLAFIREMLESVAAESAAGSHPRGCFVMNMAGEFSQTDPRVAQLIAESIAAFTGVFRKAVKRAQAEGEIPERKSASRLARFLVANMSGLRTLAKAGAGAKSLNDTAQVVVEALRA
ncbi:MAG: TetR/AcrR family transcriptional regulator [Pseudomonadales bacterium]